MLTRLRDQIGTAGLIVAIVALVAALGGGAYAASKGLNSTQKKEVKKIAKSFQGTGPQGAAGPAGAPGPAGAKGDTGAAGAAGAAGQNGVGVTSTAATIGECPSGGTKFTSASGTSKVCNGETGFTEELPSEMTETGVWSLTSTFPTTGPALLDVPFSFPIKLGSGIAGANVHIINIQGKQIPGELEQTACTGTAGAPSAEPGHFCIYLGEVDSEGEWEPSGVFLPNNFSEPGASSAGGVMTVFGELEKKIRLRGTWAVTAP